MWIWGRVVSGALFYLVLTSCSGGGGGLSGSANPPSTGSTSWSRFVGAHYTNTPNSGLTRTWADGGLRDPGGGASNYKPAVSGSGYVDNGFSVFTTLAMPEIQNLLNQDRYAVVTIGGLTPGGASVFLDSMATTAGRDTYRLAIHNRVDAIAALNVSGWQTKINFQFGNEITNSNSTGFYGTTCLWVTRNDPTPTANCDLATQFVPTYVEYYLAPGVAALEEKSQSLFARSNALQGMLGSVVNLANREPFLATLLNYQVQGTYAPAYAGQRVSDLVDAVSIHYTAVSPDWKTALDNFRATYMPGGVPATRVRTLWATEEGGANNTEQGYGMATALRVLARYLSWWQANGFTPDTAHVFFWGSDIKGPSGTTCSGCTSIDEDMPLLYNFTGDHALTEITTNRAVFGTTDSYEFYEFGVDGQDRQVLVGMVPTTGGSATLSSLSLNLSAWAGRSVSITVYKLANQGPQLLPLSSDTVVASSSATVNFSATLADHDALLVLVQAL